ncbi:MAG TPA: SulP family inorganic anion transporter [Pseudomonadales bacterium]|nr:SulP family inorganic anion transporter [Pseudomonadales bacterium]
MIALRDWLPDYRRDWLRADVVAGLTTAAVVIPKSMAYATVAGLPIQVGLYTAFVPMLVYALLGTSRPLSVSTSTTLAILTAAQLDQVAPSGDPAALLHATALLTAMVGGMLIAASVLRLGFVANFISEPVLVGFKAGIAVVIIVDQIPKILGIHFAKGTFVNNVAGIGLGLSHTSFTTLAVGVGTMVVLTGFEKFRPNWPAPLIAVAGAIAGAGLFAWQAHGIELVGAIPAGLPAFTPPDLSLAEQLWPGALGIALMSFTETIAAGRAFVAGDEPSPRPNVELLATGVANVAGAFFGAMPGGGGTSQTAVNRTTGAKTQIAGIVTALMALMTMLFLSPLIGLMPQATLAAVVIVYSIGLIQPVDFRAILRIRRTEFVWAIAAFVGVMLLGTLKGILVSIIVSLVALMHQAANPQVYSLVRKRGTNVFRPRSEEHADDESFPGLLVLRPEGRLFFVNMERVMDKMRPLVTDANPEVVVLDLSAVFDLEYTALKALTTAEQRLRDRGVSMWVAGLTPDVFAMVRRSPLGDVLGDQRMLFNVEVAVARFLASRRDNARIEM